MRFHRKGCAVLVWAVLAVAPLPSGIAPLHAAELTSLEQLGKQLFFDKALSNPSGQSCASCHSPAAGFTSPLSEFNAHGAVHPGARSKLFGNRKPPTVAYATLSPKFDYDAKDETYVGGQFWDGRAANLADQATKPLFNPVEQNLGTPALLLERLRSANYRDLYETVYGRGTLDPGAGIEERTLERVGAAIAAYEASAEVVPFSSKYDAFLAGRAMLAPAEARGLALFEGKANCFSCHPHQPDSSGRPPLFTDFTYDNLGIPKNPENPFYRMPAAVNPAGAKFVDLGLGAILKEPKQYGKFKVPTLRNVDQRPTPNFVKAYGHNGFFKSLKEVVHYYNVRDAVPGEFPAPEVPETVNHEELGNLHLTDAEENDVVAFLKTLTDGYQARHHGQPVERQPDSGAVTPAVATDATGHFDGARDLSRVIRFMQPRTTERTTERTNRPQRRN